MSEEEHASYALKPNRGREKIYGFVKRDSNIHRDIEALLSIEGKPDRAMILDLAFPVTGQFDDIVEIRALIADGWLER